MNGELARNPTRTTGVGRVGSGQVSSSSDAVLSKMINDRSTTIMSPGANGFYASDSLLDITAERQATNIDDYENILATQPDLELPIQILISSILSPKSANKITLKHSLKKNPLPVELANELLMAAKNCAENVYSIKESLPDKLRKALFTHGSSITVIMSEAGLDDVINGKIRGLSMATESVRENTIKEIMSGCTEPFGYLGNPDATEQKTTKAARMGLEGLMNEACKRSNVTSHAAMNLGKFTELPGFKAPEVVDNPKVFHLAMALESMLDDKREMLSKLANMGGGSLEAIDRLYHNVEGGIQEMSIFPRPEEASRKSKTRPVRREVPTESCTVVFQTGNPKKHLGYIFLLDEFGSFASRDTRRDYWRNISEMVGGNRETVSSILDKAAKSTRTDTTSDMMLAMAAQATFREMAIQDYERRLINGTVGNGKIGDLDAFFNLMFERAMSGRQTRVLYVPVDMVTYWAYRYNDNGTGRSLLEDTKFLAGVRSMLTVANTETAIRNSIDYTKVGITLDQNDPHKTKTKELIADQFVRQRLRSTPWNVTNPRRIVEMMQMAGVSFDIDGGDNYPGTKVQITRDDIQQREVNMDLDESIFRRLIMGLGLAPEIVDLSMQIEFSSKIVTSNELSLKRVMVIQDVTNTHIRSDVIKTFLSDTIQMEAFDEIVRNFIAKQQGSDEEKAKIDVRKIVHLFLGAYEINLPRPENGLEADTSEFTTYMEALDKVMGEVFNQDFMDGLDESGIKEHFERTVAAIRQSEAVRWMVDHDYMGQILQTIESASNGEVPEMVERAVAQYRKFNALVKTLIPRMTAQNISDGEQLTAIMTALSEQRNETQPGEGGGNTDDSSSSSSEEEPFGGSSGDDDLFGDESSLSETDAPEGGDGAGPAPEENLDEADADGKEGGSEAEAGPGEGGDAQP